MKHLLIRSLGIAACFLFLTAFILPDEGMWMLNQIDKLPWKEMQKSGLQLTPEQIYNPNGTSLKDAIILLGGGSSSFISPEGLILTNHHVAYSAIQSVSSVEEDYLANGFYAETRDKELPVRGYTAQVVVSQKDVTQEVLSAVSDTMSPETRLQAVQAKMREIQKAAKGQTDYECRITELYNGVKYVLFTYEVQRDIRLVYAPPTAIGNYGGEVDNWMWPRQTGDFSIMRVYTGADGKPGRFSKSNVPYKPKVFLPISTAPLEEGSFAMIMGFPGTTYRYRSAAEIAVSRDETLPLLMELYKTRMDIIDRAGTHDRAIQIKYASKVRGIANADKKYEGTLEGMRQSDLLNLRKKEEGEFKQFLASKPDLEKKYGTVIDDIAKAQANLRSFNKKSILYGQLYAGSEGLALGARFKNLATSFQKDSTGKMVPDQTMLSDLKDYLVTFFKDYDKNVDRELTAAMLFKASGLPYDQQIGAVQKAIGPRVDSAQRWNAVQNYVKDLYDHSKLTSLEDAQKLLGQSADDIRDDSFVKLSLELDKDNAVLQPLTSSYLANISLLRSRLLEAYMAWKGPDIYPDATRTLRFTFGTVKGFYPRDAVYYKYATTLAGVMEKETGVDPFIVPPKLKELWQKRDFGKYEDPKLHDVPVAFIGDLDITGGNSGSPVINGKGELIGLAFDGNWESVVGDYVFEDALNRSINVDSRYILFVLDKFSNAQTLLKELTIH